MKTKTKSAIITLAAGMITIVICGCRYANTENQADGYEPPVKISTIRVGKVDWNNPRLVLCYDEGGAPFSPREILTVRFADRMLMCECFNNGNTNSVPYLRLRHQCKDSEWRYICNVLKRCHIEKWSVDYVDTYACDGTSWILEIDSGEKETKRVHGFNAYPDNFKQFLQLKKYAIEHPTAIHFNQ